MWSKRGLRPICFIGEDVLLAYKWGILYKFHLKTKTLIKLRIFSYFGILECICPFFFRFLRIGIRCGIAYNDEIVLFAYGKMIYEYNIIENTLSKGFSTGRSRVLKFTKIDGIKNFENSIVFGEYFGNSQKEEVYIYRRVECDLWHKVYTFKAGEITHVHNIIPDIYNQCLWIFTGDFGKEAGIWRVDDNFKSVEPILIGKQEYRACVGFATSKGVVYATDSPFEQNSIRILFKTSVGEYNTQKIRDINGSSIYGCQCNDNYIFSSTVEPDGRDASLLKLLFNRKRGNGIIDEYVHLYFGNSDNGFKEIYKSPKDIWPYIFQFGAFIFPEGNNKTKFIPFYPIAVKKHNMSMVVIEKV